MSVTNEKAVITLEVELVASVGGLDMQDVIEDVVNQASQEAIEDAFEEEGIELESVKNITQALEDIDSKGLSNLKNLASSPGPFMEKQFITMLGRAGPYGALAAAMIGALMGGPELTKALIQAFAVKGGPLNEDYRYSQEEFLNQQYDRTTQYRRLLGDDPVITVNTVGFVVGDPDFKGNSLVDANEARSGRVGLRDSAYGYMFGV